MKNLLPLILSTLKTSQRRLWRSVRFLCLVAVTWFCASRAHAQTAAGGATISVSGTGPYQYSITLTNTGATAVGTFWYAWIPGENFLFSIPQSVQNPPGWTNSVIFGGPGNYSIQWIATTPIAPNTTVSGFSFTSSDTPAQVFGNSVNGAHPPVGTSTLYTNAPFSDAGFEFVVTAPVVIPPPLSITTTSLPDGTNGVTYSQTLAATGGQSPYTWKIASGTLPRGLTLSSAGLLSGKPAGGQFNFSAKVTDAASGTATQSLALTVITPDVTKPTLTITSPKSGARWSNEVFTVTGTAKDNVAVASVWLSVNGGVWNSATLTGNNWTNQINLVIGTNSIAAYALDSSGNFSLTNTVKLLYVVTAQITVNIVGSGTLKPDLNNDFLVLSNNYTMKATPARGFGFFFWNVGANMIDNPSLTFEMVPGLAITANFKDITPPTVSVTTPTANQKLTGYVVNLSGKASDNVAVADVLFQINANGWVDASTGNGFTNWTADGQSVVPGTNTIQVYAVDAAGNASKTNELKITAPPFWAPGTIADATIRVTPASGDPITASFGADTFNQTDIATNGDSGVGDYTYTQTDTNAARLHLTFSAPLSLSNNSPQEIQLNFTNLNEGVFHSEEDSGTFSIVSATAFLPASWAGHTITASHAANSNKTTVALAKGTDDITISSPNQSNRTGTYVATNVSPVGAMLVVTYTDQPDLGNVTYLQLTFTSKSAGHYEVNTFDSLGDQVSEGTDFGTFTFR